MRVGFKSAGANLIEPTRNIDQLATLRRPARLKFIIKPLVAEIAFIVCDPFLQPTMRLDDEFRHDSLPKYLVCNALYCPRKRGCRRAERVSFRRPGLLHVA